MQISGLNMRATLVWQLQSFIFQQALDPNSGISAKVAQDWTLPRLNSHSYGKNKQRQKEGKCNLAEKMKLQQKFCCELRSSFHAI